MYIYISMLPAIYISLTRSDFYETFILLLVFRISSIRQISRFEKHLTYRGACLEFLPVVRIAQLVSSQCVSSSRYAGVSHDLLSSLGRLDVTRRIFIATDSIFSPE